MSALEPFQLPLYLVAALLGAGLGLWVPGLVPWGEVLLWPALMVLLLATFLQVPLLALRQAFRDRAFLLAALLGNFLLVPLLVYALLQLLPPEPGLQLGVALVLLVPCTDWFLAFAHLGRGDMARALVLTPLNLFLQLLLLPLYLFLLPGGSPGGVPLASLLEAAWVVFFPLLLALFLQVRSLGRHLAAKTASWPVPLLALVVFLVALGNAGHLAGFPALFLVLGGVFALYLLLALGLAWVLARLFRLEAKAGRTLAFSLGTRNSFLVLPLALALPEGMALAPLVIVFQALVELLGMGAAFRLVPRLFP
ncbi:hypothetical protein [Thermus caliditerrae]|uniref:hypothetical protein n=1 Tax=Thermus caliditerrae TaxID=1330700 RepID=UPI00056DB86E|nr:hypothetical protein [Thermus caliditerrae]